MGSAALILGDIVPRGHRERMRVMENVWPVTALYFGPRAGWADIRGAGRTMQAPMLMQRAHAGHETMPYADRPFWQGVAIGVSHCGEGCTLGDIAGEVLVFSVGLARWGARLGAMYGVDVAIADALGIISQYLPIALMRGSGLNEGILAALKADTLSLIAFEVGMFGWMAVMYDAIRPRVEPNQPEYGFLMQVGMVIGFCTSYAANWWLIRRGIKERM